MQRQVVLAAADGRFLAEIGLKELELSCVKQMCAIPPSNSSFMKQQLALLSLGVWDDPAPGFAAAPVVRDAVGKSGRNVLPPCNADTNVLA